MPTTWSAKDNVAWSVEIKGRGWSSPVAWNNTVFVTSAISSGKFKEPSTGIYGNDYVAELAKQGLSEDEVLKRVTARDIELTSESGEIRYMVYAFDASNGKLKWEREAHKGLPFGGRHRKNTFASETPATDGERLYAYFGNVGLFAYSLDGKPLWNVRFDPQPMYLDFGTAASPVVHDGQGVRGARQRRQVVRGGDRRADRQAALARRTRSAVEGHDVGLVDAVRLETRRPHRAGRDRHDSTPCRTRRKPARSCGASAGSPASRRRRRWPRMGCSTSPPDRRAKAIARCSRCVPGASGDITLAKGEESNQFVAWFHPRASAYTSSPLVYRGRMYVVNDNGILTVFDAKTGKEIYKARAGGSGNTFSASPWAADGKVYLLSEDGHTFVIEAGDKYVELAKNSMDEMSFASPALAPNTLFLRTQTKLYRIGSRNSIHISIADQLRSRLAKSASLSQFRVSGIGLPVRSTNVMFVKPASWSFTFV